MSEQKYTPDEYSHLAVEVVGKATDNEQESVNNVVEATFAIMTGGYGNCGVWLRGDGRAEIVPNWVISARKKKQREQSPSSSKEMG